MDNTKRNKRKNDPNLDLNNSKLNLESIKNINSSNFKDNKFEQVKKEKSIIINGYHFNSKMVKLNYLKNLDCQYILKYKKTPVYNSFALFALPSGYKYYLEEFPKIHINNNFVKGNEKNYDKNCI